jgi:hypothetical protein
MIIEMGDYNIEIAPIAHHKLMQHMEATLYCNFFALNGFSNWRLPTIDELLKIYSVHDALYTRGVRLIKPIDDLQVDYWSSTITGEMQYNVMSMEGEIDVSSVIWWCYTLPVRNFT